MNHTEETNKIYQKNGFQAVINYIQNNLQYGKITQKTQNLYCISTGGWSEDEWLLHDLTSIISQFGQKHYVGYIVGGHFYFSKEAYATNHEIIER